MDDSEANLLKEFYIDEITDKEFYTKLGKRSNKPEFAERLHFLASVEEKHSEFWKSRLEKAGVKTKSLRERRLKIRILLFLTRIIGKNLTINFLERGEMESIRKYRDYLKKIDDKEDQKDLRIIIEDEISHENLFNDLSPDRGAHLDRIQAYLYGMSDGLVEVVAALAGLTAIIDDNFIIAMSGLVIGIGGTISMSLGAYLSKSSEIEYRIRNIRRDNLLSNEPFGKMRKKIELEKKRTSNSTLTTGLSYISGAAVPIIPFIFPLGIWSLIIAVILVATVQIVSNSIIAIALNISILKSSSKAAIFSLAAAGITYLVGFMFHTYFHILVL
jgi:Uncharacterized membrane protein